MLIYRFIFAAVVACAGGSLVSCSKPGPDLPPAPDGVTAVVTVSGTEAWSLDYMLVLAVFGDDPSIPLAYKKIGRPPGDGSLQAVLDELPAGAGSAAICLLDGDRRVVYLFCSEALASGAPATLRGTADLLAYRRIQRQVFSQCLRCHDAGTGFGGLKLDEGASYAALVGRKSRYSDKMLVAPGRPGDSFLIDILRGDATVSYRHNNLSSLLGDDVRLLEHWIAAGAPDR